MKTQKIILIILIFLLSIVECYLIFDSFYRYKGIHQAYSMAPVVLIILFGWYRLLFRSEKINKLKSRMIVTSLLTVLVFSFIVFTPPKYSYEEGNELIDTYAMTMDINLIERESKKYLVPIIDSPGQMLIRKFAYYYEYSDGTNELYFMIHPMTGKITRYKKY